VSDTPTPAIIPVALPSALPAPRAGIDYEFQTIFKAPPRQRITLWLLVGLLATITIGLTVSKVDIVISANGKLATTDSQIVVQPLETSIVRSVDVKVGQKVRKGALLATLDPTFTQADESELTTKLRGLQAAYDRLSADMQGVPYAPSSPNTDEQTQLDIWHKRQSEYQARVNTANRRVQQYEADVAAHKTEAQGLLEQIKLSGDAQNIYATLVASNLASRLKLIETSEHLIQVKARLDRKSVV